MRRRCNGAPIKWLGGVVLIAIGLGMSDSEMRFSDWDGICRAGGMAHQPEQKMLILLYFHIRKKAVLFKIKKNGFYHSLGIRLRV